MQIREYKEIYNYELYNDGHELQEENSRDEHEAWKDRAPDSLPMIHASTAHSDEQLRESTNFKV